MDASSHMLAWLGFKIPSQYTTRWYVLCRIVDVVYDAKVIQLVSNWFKNVFTNLANVL